MIILSIGSVWLLLQGICLFSKTFICIYCKKSFPFPFNFWVQSSFLKVNTRWLSCIIQKTAFLSSLLPSSDKCMHFLMFCCFIDSWTKPNLSSSLPVHLCWYLTLFSFMHVRHSCSFVVIGWSEKTLNFLKTKNSVLY